MLESSFQFNLNRIWCTPVIPCFLETLGDGIKYDVQRACSWFVATRRIGSPDDSFVSFLFTLLPNWLLLFFFHSLPSPDELSRVDVMWPEVRCSFGLSNKLRCCAMARTSKGTLDGSVDYFLFYFFVVHFIFFIFWWVGERVKWEVRDSSRDPSMMSMTTWPRGESGGGSVSDLEWPQN